MWELGVGALRFFNFLLQLHPHPPISQFPPPRA